MRTVCEDLSVGPNSLQPCPSPAASRCCDGGRATVTMRLAHSLRAVPSGSISSTPCKKERNRHSLYMPRRGARGFSSCYILELLLLCSLLDKINHSQPRRAETFANSETASELETMRRNQNAEGIFSFHAVFFTGQHGCCQRVLEWFEALYKQCLEHVFEGAHEHGSKRGRCVSSAFCESGDRA